jgi:very-short-patch-repair endonuclease
MESPKQRLFDGALTHLDCVLSTCMARVKTESPIEFEFAQAVYLCSIVHHNSCPSPLYAGAAIFTVHPQIEIGNYRVDFLIKSKSGDTQIVVECDGHDFHEKTKEQAAKDKKRDRYLVGRGFKVLRFTGHEIWKDPWLCALEVNDLIMMEAIS